MLNCCRKVLFTVQSHINSVFPRMRIFTDTLMLFIPLSMMTFAISASYLKSELLSSHYNGLFHIAEDEDLHRHISVLQTPVHGVDLYSQLEKKLLALWWWNARHLSSCLQWKRCDGPEWQHLLINPAAKAELWCKAGRSKCCDVKSGTFFSHSSPIWTLLWPLPLLSALFEWRHCGHILLYPPPSTQLEPGFTSLGTVHLAPSKRNSTESKSASVTALLEDTRESTSESQHLFLPFPLFFNGNLSPTQIRKTLGDSCNDEFQLQNISSIIYFQEANIKFFI